MLRRTKSLSVAEDERHSGTGSAPGSRTASSATSVVDSPARTSSSPARVSSASRRRPKQYRQTPHAASSDSTFSPPGVLRFTMTSRSAARIRSMTSSCRPDPSCLVGPPWALRTSTSWRRFPSSQAAHASGMGLQRWASSLRYSAATHGVPSDAEPFPAGVSGHACESLSFHRSTTDTSSPGSPPRLSTTARFHAGTVRDCKTIPTRMLWFCEPEGPSEVLRSGPLDEKGLAMAISRRISRSDESEV